VLGRRPKLFEPSPAYFDTPEIRLKGVGGVTNFDPTRRSMTMPLIEVHLIEKVFTSEQKRQIIQKLTDAMVSIEGENMRDVTWVKLTEVRSGDWGMGGKPMTTEAVKELAAGRRAA
jgi:4-oxalocrotonate tautomerase